MADQSDIDAVKSVLPDDSDNLGWTEEYIGQRLDAGISINGVVAEYWEKKAAATSNYMNITESGSSRSMGDIHSNAMDMAKMYRDRIPTEPVVNARNRLKSIRTKRV